MKGFTPHILLQEPLLSFHPDRDADRHVHPLRGLLRFGPYSASLLPDPIRVATIAPSGESGVLFDFMKDLHSHHRPRERREYLPEWPGFRAVFNVRMQAAPSTCRLELGESLEKELAGSEKPHVLLSQRISEAVNNLVRLRSEFDVLFIYLPERWYTAFEGDSQDDFDLHDYLKAMTASRGIPIQIVRQDKALAYPCRASVMWRIGLALYVKAGGIPWKLWRDHSDTAHVAISYAVRPGGGDRPRFITCCSQVFDSEGAGLEFIAYDAAEVQLRNDNPFLSRTEMFRVMTRSLDLYRRRHAGRVPRRVMVHKNTEFKRDEVDGCMEALHLSESVDLIQVVQDVGWRGVRVEGRRGEENGSPTAFPVARGTLLGISPRDALLWTHGDVTGIGDKSYFQGGRGTPRPIRLVRHAGHGPWDDVASAVLGLSKMDWNNDALYSVLPVTMSYASTLARVVRRMPTLGNTPYAFRFFM